MFAVRFNTAPNKTAEQPHFLNIYILDYIITRSILEWLNSNGNGSVREPRWCNFHEWATGNKLSWHCFHSDAHVIFGISAQVSFIRNRSRDPFSNKLGAPVETLVKIILLQFSQWQFRADSRLALSQWETSLQSNTVPHWLGANLESALWFSYVRIVCILKLSNCPGVYKIESPPDQYRC